jgi:hypothetical protein
MAVPVITTERVKEEVEGEGLFKLNARICQEGEGEGEAAGEEATEDAMEELRLA